MIFAFLLLAVSAHAQVPGFMGRRFTLFLDANPTPAIFVQNANNTLATYTESGRPHRKESYLAYNFRPQITAEYLVHRDVSLGLSYSRISVGTVRGILTHPDATEFEPDFDVVKGQGLGLHVKVFPFNKSASIAPIGFYKTLSIYLTQTNTYDDKKSKAKLFEKEFTYPVVSLGFGRQSMIAKYFIVKMGIELGWAFVPGNFWSESEEDWTMQEYAGYNVHQSLFGHYMFNVNLGVGYTIF
jgi:hypothetical protein